jgi:hypothetical protein
MFTINHSKPTPKFLFFGENLSERAKLYSLNSFNLSQGGRDPHDLFLSNRAPYQPQGQGLVVANPKEELHRSGRGLLPQCGVFQRPAPG